MDRLRSPNGDRLDSLVSHFRVRWRTLLLPALTESGSNGVAELDGDDQGDAPVCVEDAQGGACGVERLADYDSALNGLGYFARDVVFQEAQFRGASPGEVERAAQEKDVEPVGQQRGSVRGVFGE